MKLKKIIIYAIVLTLVLATWVTPVYGATLSLSGASGVTAGSTISIKIVLGESSYGAEGTISYDSAKFTYTSYSAGAGWTATYSSSTKRFTAYRPDGGKGSGTILTLVFRAKAGTSGTTTVKASNVKVSVSGGEKTTSASKTITITKPATPVALSSDATLKSLSVDEGTLSPAFASSTTNYSLSVPYETEKLKISPIPNSTKASVSINSYTLTPGDKVPVKIVVTAENGDTKTYTIQTIRALPGDYVASDDALLVKLVSDYGKLSPAFDSNVFYYAIDVPYECSTINFTATTSFHRATFNILGNKKLSPGIDNVFYVVVMAEDGKTSRVYTITVRRSAFYSIYLKDSYVDEIIHEINQQVGTIVMDLSAASIQAVDSRILAALQDNPDRRLVIRCIGARCSIKGEDLTGQIHDGFYDFTINPSSRYGEDMLSKGSDGLSEVFSSHHQGPWPGAVEYAVDTSFGTGDTVNVYRYDPDKDQYVAIAENVSVLGGTVVFVSSMGGDFLITTATLSDAVASGEAPGQPNGVPSMDTFYLAAMGISLFALGVLLGILGKRFFRRR